MDTLLRTVSFLATPSLRANNYKTIVTRGRQHGIHVINYARITYGAKFEILLIRI